MFFSNFTLSVFSKHLFGFHRNGNSFHSQILSTYVFTKQYKYNKKYSWMNLGINSKRLRNHTTQPVGAEVHRLTKKQYTSSSVY